MSEEELETIAEEAQVDDPIQQLRGEVSRLEAHVTDLTDRLARARADYDNLQKRVTRDAAAERDRVRARVLEGFLQIYEYGQMAAVEAEKHPGPLAEGIKLVVREFGRLLEQEDVTHIGAIGEPFDASLHEAIAEEPGEAPGAISRVIQPGYRLGDRVLRYAKVAVAPSDEAE